MKDPVNFDNLIEFSHVNNDFSGVRKVSTKSKEDVEFLGDSSVRIWYNDLSEDYDAHCHTALEIIMPVKNYYHAEVEGQQFHIMPEEILIIPPGMLHSLKAPKYGIRFIYLLDISHITTLKGFSGIQPILSQPLYVTKAAYPAIYSDVYHTLVQMQNEYFYKNEFYELTIFSLLINMFVQFGYNRINSQGLFPNVRIYKQKEYIQKLNDLLEYLDTHYAEPINLESAASSIGFSKYHFSRLFKQYTNYTFGDYLCYRRMRAAEDLLAQPNLSITEVALQAGFPSISTFNRLFRQKNNCSPSEYRAKNQALNKLKRRE